jgi:cell division protein ZipA
MEPEILRLILAILAVITIFSIYTWEKIRRQNRDESEVMQGFDADTPDVLVDSQPLQADGQKSILPKMSTEEQLKSDQVVPSFNAKAKTAVNLANLKAEKNKLVTKPKKLIAKVDKPVKEKVSQNAEITQPEAAKITAKKVAQKIFALNVVANKGKIFDGDKILEVVNQEKLEYGSMKIFHKRDSDDENQITFSMVNMVEPGYFELDDIAQAQTPGVTFFMQLPGSQDSMAMFSDMLFTAERVASTLDGNVLDAGHHVLDQDLVNSMRQEIMNFDQQARLI